VINTTFASVCAVILLGLIFYTQGRKMWVKRKGKAMRCEACGRTIVDRPVRMEQDGRELVFCCEHCADAYVRGGRDESDGKTAKDDG
jgi:hypothetical protein